MFAAYYDYKICDFEDTYYHTASIALICIYTTLVHWPVMRTTYSPTR